MSRIHIDNLIDEDTTDLVALDRNGDLHYLGECESKEALDAKLNKLNIDAIMVLEAPHLMYWREWMDNLFGIDSSAVIEYNESSQIH